MYPSLNQPSPQYASSQSGLQTKTGACYKCQTSLTIPVSECLAHCSNCNRANLFLCHVIKKEDNMTSSNFTTVRKQQIACPTCHTSYAIITCPKCKGYSAIRDFRSGVGYECVCGWKGVYLGCDRCGEVLALPPGKDFQRVGLKCPGCSWQFRYRLCGSCGKCVYQGVEDTSDIYLCKTNKCPESGTGQTNVFNANPYGIQSERGSLPIGVIGNEKTTLPLYPQINSIPPNNQKDQQQMNYRVSRFEEETKNQTQTDKFKDYCKVCFNNEAVMINTSCYHLAVCEKCAADVQQKLQGKCPVCRSCGNYQKVFRA